MCNKGNLRYSDSSIALMDAVDGGRILVLDGAMGTMIQRCGLTEADFRGERFANNRCQLKGCNDLLVLTAPETVSRIHEEYLRAGASIIETNTFNANAVSLSDYGLADYVEEINFTAAQLARQVADKYCTEHPGAECWVAGSVGPTSKSLSMSSGIDAPGGGMTWDELADTYTVQMSALISGGVDVLLIETVFDGLNAKAALYAAQRAMEKSSRKVPVMMSVTLTESGRTLSGQTLEAFVATVAHGELLSVGLNCGFGADGMVKHIDTLQNIPMAVSVYPNAGLPNEMGEYDETPEMMAAKLRHLMESGRVNIVGGCCGTTPDHIRAIASIARMSKGRRIPAGDGCLVLAGLEPLEVSSRCNFMNVGERCNVAGSRKFLRLIKEKKIDEAIDVARSQVESGAQVIDINMDDAMLDASEEMSAFIDRIGVEPDVARVPVMIDSSSWEAVVSGLKHVQGRPIVNSISLKEGESRFVEKAVFIREMGAAVVVMAFDEHGQADTYERKIEVCGRAYRILTETVGFRGHEIIFDPNVLAVATGIEAHNNYALDFIRAVEWIKSNLPGAKVSGGISNLSFSFRGNNYVREAMHAVFLYHAISKGLDMAIVNAASMMPFDDVPAELRGALEDVIFNRCADATERLVAIAECSKGERPPGIADGKESEAVSMTASEKIEQMLVKGVTDGMEQYLSEAMAETGSAMAVIDGALMKGMNRVGELFGAGKMFLPQVVKSARTMKQAVVRLTPYIENEKRIKGNKVSGRMVIATVKGDVHDIGKNIVNVIMGCNGFEMVDMGVMVPGEDIVDKARSEHADFVALSGLITPSLEEMCNVARLMETNGMDIPLMIGGATTSALHTAVKIAPCYSGPVVYTRDAAMLPAVAQGFMNRETRAAAIEENKKNQERLRSEYYRTTGGRLSIEDARARRFEYGEDTVIPTPRHPGIHNLTVTVEEARRLINWRAFFAVWRLDASFASVAQIQGCDHCRAQWLASVPEDHRAKAAEAMQLWKEAERVLDRLESVLSGDGLHVRVALLPAGSRDEEIEYRDGDGIYVLPTPRQQNGDADVCLALSDYVKPIGEGGVPEDWIGLFAVTSGKRINDIIEEYKQDGDDYNAILYQSIADRLAEAATEIMHRKVCRELWGYEGRGIRPAIGYPSLPDQRLVFLADKVLDYKSLGVTLTDNGAMYPPASTTGYIIAHPRARYFSV